MALEDVPEDVKTLQEMEARTKERIRVLKQTIGQWNYYPLDKEEEYREIYGPGPMAEPNARALDEVRRMRKAWERHFRDTGTHYVGCEADHALCAISYLLRLAGEVFEE